MKRILTLLTVCLMASVAMAQNAGIMVSVNKGNGGLKFFRSNQLMEAIKAAEINDTIYFTAGSFDFSQLPQIDDNYYQYEWSKPLVVIGAGAQDDNGTSVSMPGTLYLKFDDSIPLEKRNVSFEGIYIPNWVSPGSEVNELTFRNFRGDFYDRNDMLQNEEGAEDWVKPHTYIHKVVFDNCYMDHINLEERNVNKIEVNNSRMSEVNGACAEVLEGQTFTLDHCRIAEVSSGFEGLIMSSLVRSDYSGADGQFESCGIYNRELDPSKDKNCVRVDYFYYSNDEMPSANDGGSTTLADGTSMGLTADYTLYPSYPTLDVKKSEIDYDGINNQISITINLLGVNDEAANEQ